MNRLDNLIRSMSRNEKGYFKKYASRHSSESESKYIELFDIIQSSTNYDERKIKAHFKEDKFVRNLPVAKKYLYDQIIKSLLAYRGEKTLANKLDWLINKADILFSKELIPECKQTLRQARKFAIETESFYSLLRIIDLEKKIAGIFNYKGIYKRISVLLHEEHEVFTKLINLNAYQMIYYKVYDTIKRNRTTRTKREIKKLSKLMKDDIFSDIGFALSHRASITFCSTWTFYYDLTGEYEKGYPYAEKLIEIWESKPAMVKENTDKYISSIQNFLNRCYRLRKLEKLWIGIEKLMNIKANSISLEVRLFETIHHFKFLYYSLSYDVNNADKVIHAVEEGFSDYGDLIKQNYYKLFCFNISNHLIRTARFDEALIWVNKILNIEKKGIQQDIQHFNLIHNLIVHYELDHYESLVHFLRSTARYYQNEHQLYRFESLVLEFLRKAIANWNKYDFKSLYVEYLEKAAALRDDPFEKRLFEYFDFETWLKSKIRRKSMMDVYLEDQRQMIQDS